MSVQSIGQDSTNSWLAQMLASYSGQTSSASSSLASLLGTTSSTGDDSANSSSTSSTSSVGSFNDILQALLAGNGSVGYDMTTGSLTDLSGTTQAGAMPPPPPPGEGSDGISREVSETENADGSLSRSVTMTDADGNVVGTEKTTQNADGSYSTVMTMLQADGTTSTRTMTGSYDADGKFVEKNTLTAADGTVLESGTITTAEDGSFTSTMTMTGPDGKTTTHSASGAYADDGSFTVKSSLADADGNILESGSEITAADGSSTYTVTRTGPDGKTATETEVYDASGALVSTSTSTPTSSASSGTSQVAGSGGSSGASGSSSGSSGSSNSEETTTTVTTAFTTEGMTQTTVVTDADGKILDKSVKDFPFSTKAEGQAYGATEASKGGLSSMLDQYAQGRYGADRYAAMAASGETNGQSGFSAQA